MSTQQEIDITQYKTIPKVKIKKEIVQEWVGVENITRLTIQAEKEKQKISKKNLNRKS